MIVLSVHSHVAITHWRWWHCISIVVAMMMYKNKTWFQYSTVVRCVYLMLFIEQCITRSCAVVVVWEMTIECVGTHRFIPTQLNVCVLL